MKVVGKLLQQSCILTYLSIFLHYFCNILSITFHLFHYISPRVFQTKVTSAHRGNVAEAHGRKVSEWNHFL